MYIATFEAFLKNQLSSTKTTEENKMLKTDSKEASYEGSTD